MRRFFFWVITGVFLFPSFVQARTPSDYLRAEQWYLDAVSAYEAWDVETGSAEVVVAVLDTGIDLEHPDLADNLWTNVDEVLDGADNDHNGYEDDVWGWDFVDGDIDPSPTIPEHPDEQAISHGTVVAGVIGAIGDNGLGIAGLNWQLQIMPLRVLDETGSGSSQSVAKAITYAVENGADVINLSFVTETYDQKLADTIAWAIDEGVVVVTSVGNTDDTGAQLGPLHPVYPACFDIHYGKNRVVAVAASDKQDARADFSNYGSACTDLSAPGVDVFGTVFHSEELASFVSLYGGPWQGTSLAAPMVSGAAALIRAAYPRLTPEQVRYALQFSVDPSKEPDLLVRRELGAGRLNIARALDIASEYASSGVRTTSDVDRTPSHSFVVVQGRGSIPLVKRMNSRGETVSSFLAYEAAFLGGLELAVGDVSGDGVEEIVTGAGEGGGPQVRIFDLYGNVQNQFFAFDEDGRTGIFVDVADLDQDGIEEIVVSQGTGGNGQVRIFRADGTLLGAFYPLQRTEEAIQVTSGNLDDDGAEEMLFWRQSTGSTDVLVYDGTGSYVRSIRLDGGSIAVQDVDGDGVDEILTGAAPETPALISVYEGSGALRLRFTPFASTFLGGVSVSAGDIDGNGEAEIYATPGGTGGPQLQVFNRSGKLLTSFFAFDETGRAGAVSALW